jgi:hypothetical protein
MERVKRRILGCLAACTLAGGAMTAAVPAASAASTACGSACFSFWSEEYGTTLVMDVPATSYQQGSIVALGEKGNTTTEDFESLYAGTTTQFYDAGLIGPVMAETWPGAAMYEYEFTPGGKASDLCVGTGVAAADSTGLVLEPCGVNDLTLWMPLTSGELYGYEPLVAGSDNRATSPYVICTTRFEGELETYELSSPAVTGEMWAKLGGVL